MPFTPTPKLVLKNQFGEESINQVINAKTVVTLTAAQVIALHTTAITLVAAVAGKVIKVSDVKMNYVKGTSAFTIGSSKHLTVQYATSAIAIAAQAETGFIDQSTSQESDLFGPGVGGQNVRGEAVQIISDDTGISVGTGSTVVVTVFYQLV